MSDRWLNIKLQSDYVFTDIEQGVAVRLFKDFFLVCSL